MCGFHPVVVYHIKNLQTATFPVVGVSTYVNFDQKRGCTHSANLLWSIA